jgi:hypothetical protein
MDRTIKLKDWIFLGIDQTGAVQKNGKAKPLPACLLYKEQVHLFYLESLSRKGLIETVRKTTGQKSLSKLLTCIDCVLGLPKSLDLDWRESLERVTKVEGLGRKPASIFFHQLGQGQILKRQVEIICKAQSVFQEKPFQKNIQTGTFRIWKELQLASKDFYVPALEDKKFSTQLPIFEGYPSYSWKVLFGSNKRDGKRMSEFVKNKKVAIKWNRKHQAMVEKDPNLADAFVLALTIKKFKQEALNQVPTTEGSILGL